ncbi:hypothetical protein E2C01_013166 [Portunus trituberculatus]|uniref:Uncharacterized protein n=1 Tax=Portunus trituberculatus TaxID=210409 RepID=A0A5B7DFI0_PORTR|nr:hypothetical protein [Portunus trituberculatus]
MIHYSSTARHLLSVAKGLVEFDASEALLQAVVVHLCGGLVAWVHRVFIAKFICPGSLLQENLVRREMAGWKYVCSASTITLTSRSLAYCEE